MQMDESCDWWAPLPTSLISNKRKPNCRKRWGNRQPRPTRSGSSAARTSNYKRCSIPWSSPRHACVTRIMPGCFNAKANIFAGVPASATRPTYMSASRISSKTRPVLADRGSATGRAALEGKVVHIPDVLLDAEYAYGEAQKIAGYRAALGVPLLRQGDVIGVIFVAKIAPQPFT